MKGKVFLIAVLAALLLTVAAAGTLAALNGRSGTLENTFRSGEADIELYETTGNTAKSSITVENTGDVSVYVRVALVGYWVGNDDDLDVKGQVWPDAATITGGYNTADWTQHDGYYYYNSVLAPDAITDDLVSSAFTGDKDSAPEGYHLEIDVLAECIQAAGGAAEAAWGYTPGSGS